jgi:hypothetical protein
MAKLWLTRRKGKTFGKHVRAFHGRINSSPLKPLIAVSPDDDVDDACMAPWLSPREAETLARNLLKAVAYLRPKPSPAGSEGGE